ncbi:unnamed protein product, partial [Ixodes persulcatus]
NWVSTDLSPVTRAKVFLYSAYSEDRLSRPAVLVIGAYATRGGTALSYWLQFSDGNVTVGNAEKRSSSEHWNLKYTATFFTCFYTKSDNYSRPVRIRLKETSQPCWSPAISVRSRGPVPGHPKGKLAVCVKPLHYSYDRALWFAEFVEFHWMLGVEHFFFYNHSIGPNVERLIGHYTARGLATVLPWTLEIRSQKEIRTEGIFASLNDCVYRCQHHFEHVLNLDLDEFVVPRGEDSLADLVAKIRVKHAGAKALVVRNTFFYLYWNNDTRAYGALPEEASPRQLPYLLTQYKTRRSWRIFWPGTRSKYIVDPMSAIEVGNHRVWRFAGPKATYTVPESDALLHHYRICEYGGFHCVLQPSVLDYTALRFNATLLRLVNAVCADAFPAAGRCPKTPPLGDPW